MKLRTTPGFIKQYRKLPLAIRNKADKQLKHFILSSSYPSLHLKKMKGYEDVWEIRVSRGYRITLSRHSDGWILRSIGSHDILRKP